MKDGLGEQGLVDPLNGRQDEGKKGDEQPVQRVSSHDGPMSLKLDLLPGERDVEGVFVMRDLDREVCAVGAAWDPGLGVRRDVFGATAPTSRDLCPVLFQDVGPRFDCPLRVTSGLLFITMR